MSIYNKYYRGSEWRKWDLHIHTPYTFLNKYNASEEDFINSLLSKEISVIGLTNYFKFAEEEFALKDKLENKGVKVFLNLELRLDYQNKDDECLDLHVIFSDKVSKESIQKFLQNMNVNVSGVTKKCIDITNIEDFKTAVVSYDELRNVLESPALCLSGKYLIGFLSRGKGNARTNSNYEKITQTAHLLIHSSDNNNNVLTDRDFWKKYNKPLLQNSDAHCLNDIGTKFTWIKADPTFEGLKQITYEPIDRVSTEMTHPEKKGDYQVIDRIEIKHADINNKSIQFNSALNSIIGGRSTGKSILLATIAYNQKTYLGLSHNKSYKDYIQSIANDIKVFWRDDPQKINPDREVEYFEQNFMYNLARDKAKLKELIDSILKKKGKASYLQEYSTNLSKHKKSVSLAIEELFQTLDQIISQEKTLSDKGDVKGVESEITKLEEILKKFNKETITPEQIASYHNDKKKIQQLNADIEHLNRDLEEFKKVEKASLIRENIQYDWISISEENRERLINELGLLKSEFDRKWVKRLNILVQLIEINIKNKVDSKSALENDSDFKKISSIFSNSDQMKSTQERIDKEKKKYSEIQKLIDFIRKLKEKKATILSNLKLLNATPHKLAIELKSKLKAETGNLKIQPRVEFQKNKIEGLLQLALNMQHGAGRFFLNQLEDVDNNEAAASFIEALLIALIDNKIPLKGGYTNKNLLQNLLSDSYYQITYDLIYEKDSFENMSDGKKSFVVLKLLLDFSDKYCPILIDQPEDDLDNRSIFNDLVNYLRSKKKQRQIIVATHNANVVVTADSELIITANQNGDSSKNTDNKKFEYVSGALEHTFKTEDNRILYSQGTQEHVCDILEGGQLAFSKRGDKYNLN